MARSGWNAYHQGMIEDERIDALKAALAAMRQKRQDWVTRLNNLKMGEVDALSATAREEEEALRLLAVADD